jgi:hypothetical protein
VTRLLLLILITIHYRWINITTVDQPQKDANDSGAFTKIPLPVAHLLKDVTDNGVFAPRH